MAITALVVSTSCVLMSENNVLSSRLLYDVILESVALRCLRVRALPAAQPPFFVMQKLHTHRATHAC